MSDPAPTQRDVESFRSAIVQRLGLHFDDTRLGFLGEVLHRRLGRLGHSSESYLCDLLRAASTGELPALARELTVGETYFFRNIEQFQALQEVVLPARMRAEKAPRLLRILSAGCASGEEAYSIAISARETMADPAWSVAIRGIDLNPGALEKAARARYTPWALRETPAHIRSRWFFRDGSDLVLDETVRSAVQFEPGNLASDDPGLWAPATYDVIFCRNVLMYFSPEQMRAVVTRIARALVPGGFLFLGHAETLRGVSDAFHLHHTHGTFYYERKHQDWAPSGGVLADAILPPAHPPMAPQGTAWFQQISAASERIAALMPAPSADVPAVSTTEARWTFEQALDLLRRDCFAEALAHVRAAPPDAASDSDVLLLEATLLVHGGHVKDAEDVSRRLLQTADLSADARYVLGLCREQSADPEGAAEQYRLAARLDPGFAMPRLRLGLVARLRGDRAPAGGELARALSLLECEEEHRLLLFGGGFSREALMALCRSALQGKRGSQ